MQLQTRRGSLVQDRFPDLVAAAEQLPGGLVLDGELLVWDPEAGGQSFEALQRRAAARARTAPALAARLPAHFVAFDVLQADGVNGWVSGSGWASAGHARLPLLLLHSVADLGCHGVTKLLPQAVQQQGGWLS